MEEIAAEADVTKPVLYREIGDRAALVSALAEILINRITEAVGDAVVGNVEPRAQLEAAVAGYLSAVDAHRHLFLFVIAGRQRPDEVRHLVEQSATAMIKLFESAPGIATSTQARTWAYSIVGVFHTVTTMWLGDQYCDRDQLAADLSALLWPALEFAGK